MTAKRPWWQSPLLHFVLFGALVFTINAAFSNPPPNEPPADASHTITVTPELIADLKRQKRQLLERPPSEAELNQAVDAWIETELLVREALRRNLDVDDPTVRAHLARKMTFVLDAREVAPVPTEDELRTLYKDTLADWRLETQLTLRQLFIRGEQPSPDQPTAQTPEARARDLLAKATDGAPLDALKAASDPPPGGPVLRGRSLDRLQARYGDAFVQGLGEVTPQTWTLRQSPLGWHVVRVEARRDGRQLTFDQARARVLARWQAQRIKEASSTALTQLRGQYTVVGWPP